MSITAHSSRVIRFLPGRIRLEFAGLLHSKPTELSLRLDLALLAGVTKAEASAITGRILVVYDERQTTERQLLHQLELLESKYNGHDKEGTNIQPGQGAPENAAAKREAYAEAAASLETPELPPQPSGHANSLQNSRAMSKTPSTTPTPVYPRSASPPGVPLPLAFAMGGLLVLGTKQLIFGKSALAVSPVPFYMSGLVAAVTGYPFLRRGFNRLTKQGKLSPDLILGTAALGLALVRENLVVLGTLSILQYVNWKRSRIGPADTDAPPLSPEIQAYSERAGRLGMAAAAATWLFTRSPLRAIAVLLAANPRPATIPVKTAWQQAELYSKEVQPSLPQGASLSHLAQTGTLLLEDTSLLMQTNIQETECVSHEEDPDKIICLTAGLMKKTTHPWKEEVLQKAKLTCRTLRSAFHVAEEEDGISGLISNTSYCVGNLAYCKRHGVSFERYYLEAKRIESKGCEVLYLAKKIGGNWISQGLIYRSQQLDSGRRALLARAGQQGIQAAVLEDSPGIGREALARLGLQTDWLDTPINEAVERIAKLHEQGNRVLLVSESSGEYSRYLKEAGVAGVSFEQLEQVLDTKQSAQKIESTINEHFQITKKWNFIGSLLAAFGVLSAPIANLASDALSLIFLTRSQKLAQQAFPADAAYAAGAHNEVAATAEAAMWHGLPWESVTQQLQVNVQHGLTAAQVNELRSRYGMNRLAEKEHTPWIVSYASQFKEFTTLILLGTSVLALFTGGLFDGLAMGAVLLANAAIGTFQERKAERIVESLNQFQPPASKVIRDGAEQNISAIDLVPGDIVCLEPGDRVPADIRLIRAWNLEVNESALTGESVPVVKQETEAEGDCPLSERSCMLYMGTDISRGKALGVVVQTGMNTEFGHLMSLLKTNEKTTTPLQEKVTSISKKFIKWAFIAGSIVFISGLLRGVPFPQLVSTSITLVASAIPEGLPVTITIALSAGIYRMSKKNALVRKLSALETLGHATIICTDKTGTLTKNEMTVRQVTAIGRTWEVSGNGYGPEGGFREKSRAEGGFDLPDSTAYESSAAQPELQRILQIACLCNNSKLVKQGDVWSMQGDPTEGALLAMAYKGGVKPEQLTHWHRGAEVPFDSGTGKMSVVCKDTSSGHACYIFSKGSVESILRRCSRYQQNGEMYPVTEQLRADILKESERLASSALRVLGFAYRPLEADEHDQQADLDERDMIYVGMAGMIDPPKADVRKSIEEALSLGVKPVMITGDHPITAIAIAEQIGITDGNRPGQVLTGHELDRMSDEELEQSVDRVSIFARMTPEHKLRIVSMLRKKGHIVAMTGDGVNDSPAIKRADVGIAMGQAGTEVSKATADIVLKEDHFGSIVEGVKEGRTIIGNIRKALGCLLTGNLAEILVTSVAVIAGMPIPLVPIQILLMNMLTDALPAMVLAVNPGSKAKRTKRANIVDKPLYRKVITRGVLLGTGSLGLFGLALASGQPVAVAQSVAFATLVAGQLIQTFSWRQEGTEQTVGDWSKDRFLVGALSISWLALLGALYVPPLNHFFHTAPIPLQLWGPILLVAGSISWLSRPILSFLERKDDKTGTAALSYSAA
ncbi:potassium and/or sodium efflux P-type ATPase [Paenibacillus sophorae]|uniref:HAD-IC family P-type ATPase n=1 Tax=Paenibacillus sophorae TaxID=1333845 RepID=A0A1H8M6E4_9BACL|nr:HAD-IC family P-type ATPase [Paenibacillus sophorae]QWU17691.1 HAD-IC family P-type ATPase [Paenibacillus sophorae]SEO12924.1 potassium and/or sodium efflux P-type ATPase [Paenibacillus sophorae]